VLDASGRRVCALVNDVLDAGDHVTRWSGRDDEGAVLAAGVYFLRIESGERTASRRVVFAR
jgi:hypothetical protein